MADNVAQSIKNLQTSLEALDSQLLKSQKGAKELGNMIQKAMVDSGVSVDEFLKHLRNTVGAQKENKISLVLELTDAKGKPLTAASIQSEISELTKSKGNPIRLNELKELQKIMGDPLKLYDDLNRVVNEFLTKQRRQLAEQQRIDAQRVRSAQETAKILTIEKGRLALKGLESNPKLNTAVQQQLKYMQEIRRIGKDINTLQSNKHRNEEENIILAQRKKQLREILTLQQELNNKQPYSANIARTIDKYNQLRGSVRSTNEEIKRTNTSLESMLPTLRRLAAAFGVTFSIQGLVQFGKKLIETRGEFEIQFVAMKQIIQDTDAATRIWNQTMQQALRSPFKAMQLVDYTKKLAAYRIETDKLFDTTKRLADVSAGLGVDMGRLILAYGQVKAANYLRASEVRQFTEAGVNIYGELAKYFSEVEGRAVHTGEVVERVSKRMVLFSDVEKIFQRMTDEGGVFFNMQEVQADTVKGQINKLRDAYDQMLNTIGEKNNGKIRKWVERLNDWVQNWQNLAFVLKANVNWFTILGGALVLLSNRYLKQATTETLWFSKALLGTDKTLLKSTADVRIFSSVLGDYSRKTRIAIVAIRTLQGAVGMLGNILRTVWPLLAFEILVKAIERISRSTREMNRFKEELNDIAATNVEQMHEEINGYDRLVEKLKKTNEGSVERKKILNEISSKYGKYLDFVVDETTKVEDLAKAYDKVVSSIRTYTAEKIRDEQQTKMEKAIYDEYQAMVKNLEGKKVYTDADNYFTITKEQARNIAKIAEKNLKEIGSLNAQSLLETYFGKDLRNAEGLKGAGKILNDYAEAYKKYSQKLQDIRDDIEEDTPIFKKTEEGTDEEYERYKERRALADKELQEQEERNKHIQEVIKSNATDETVLNEALARQQEDNDKKRIDILKKYGLTASSEYKQLINKYKNELDDYENSINEKLEAWARKQGGPFWRQSKEAARLITIINEVKSTNDRLQQGSAKWEQTLIENYKTAKDGLKRLEKQMVSADGKAKKSLQDQISHLKLIIEAIELVASKDFRNLDLSGKTTTTTGRNYMNISNLISLLKEMNSEYDKLSKSAYGFAKSNEKVVESFTPAFKEIFGFAGIDISQVDTTSKKSTADAMKLVIDKLDANKQWGRFGKDGGKKARQEFIKAWGEMAVEADIEVKTRIREDFARDIEDMFGNYELSLELQKLNIPQDVLNDMFDIDAIALPDIRAKLDEWYAQQGADLNEEFFAKYQSYIKKLDEEERKLQKQRLKDYSKYLEYQLSERAKLEMEYVRKLAEVQSESAFTEQQKKQISDGLKREYEESIAKQDWEDFKGSEFYVGMMEDLSRQGTASLEVMRSELMKLRDNAENLSPRALKEMVNALEKIEEVERGRKPPFQRIREEAEKLKDIDIAKTFKDIADAEQRQVDEQNKLKSIQKLIGARQEEQKQLSLISKQDSDIQQMNIEYAKEELSFVQRQIRLHKENKPSSVDQNVFRAWEFTGNQLNARSESLSSYIDQLETLEKVQKTINSDEFSWAKDLTLEDLLGDEDFLKEQLKLTDTEITNLRLLTNTFDRLAKAEQDALNEIKDYISKVNALGKSVSDLVKNFGGDTNPVTEWWEQMGDTAVNSVTNAIDALKEYKDAVAKNVKDGKNLLEAGATGDYVRLALAALKIIVDVFAQIGLFRDARIDKEIEDQKEKIDQLTMAYERLEKSIERTLTTASYMSDMSKMVQNINAQISATEQQLAAARSRKSVDNDEVRGYEKSLQDLYNQLDELQQKQIEVFGGIGRDNYRSWAEGFVDAWKSAFLETRDGLDALQEHFDEFLQEWFVKQATMRIAAKALEPIMTEIDKSVSGGDVDLNRLWQIKEQMQSALAQLNIDLTEFAGMWDLGGEGGLSGLAAGIQGMTEEQANILEAYWNSVRAYTASIDMNVARIAEALGVGGPNNNPMIKQLIAIANNTAKIGDIYTLLVNSQSNLGQGKGFITYSL